MREIIVIITVAVIIMTLIGWGFTTSMKHFHRQVLINTANEIFRDLINPAILLTTYNLSKRITITIDKKKILKSSPTEEEYESRKIEHEKKIKKHRERFPYDKHTFSDLLPREKVFALLDTSKSGIAVLITYLDEDKNPNIGVHIYNASSGFSYSKYGYIDFPKV